MKKTICIAIPPNLPMPAVKGGAIETLLQNVIDTNEIKKDCKLIIFSVYDKEAEEKSKNYKEAKFIYYNFKKLDKCKYFIFRVFRKILKLQVTSLEPYENYINRYIENNHVDVFVNESADFNAFKKVSKKLGKQNCYAHLHSEFSSSKTIDDTFGTVISVSGYIKKKWLESSKISSTHVKVLRNCANRDLFSKKISEKDKRNIRSKLNISKKDFVVLFSGRIVPQKGVKELIQAISNIKGKNIKLLIIGSANFGKTTTTQYQKEIIEKIKSLKDKVIFTGYVDHSELYKYYNIANCAVIPSTYEDPAPLVTIEAMMAQKALIVTNSGGIPEYVSGNNAIIVKKETKLVSQLVHAIIKLYEDPVLRKSMGEESFKRSMEYTQNNYYENYLNIIKAR